MLSSYLILPIVTLLSLSFVSAKWFDCGPAKSFVVELENHQKISVYDAKIKVKFERNELAVYSYPGIDAVNILIDNALVDFSGNIVPEDGELESAPFKTSRIFNTKIAGSARLTKNIFNEVVLSDYNIYLARNRNEEDSKIPKRVQIEIIHEAASCIRPIMYEELGVITFEDMEKAERHSFEFGSLSVFSADNAEPRISAQDIQSLISVYDGQSSSTAFNRYGLQSTVNKIVDLAVSQLVKKIHEEKEGIIKIPDMHHNFSTGSSFWKVTGEFDAFDGTFEDLTSLKRTQDAQLSHTGMKFIASCGFGLSRAGMEYENYKLRYGIVKVNGKLSASINNVALAADVAVDYNQKPCRAVLQDVRVSELGKIKIKFTGLGPLNKLLSKLVTWITKKWQNEIVAKVENKLEEIIVKNLDKFNCEKYRP